MIGVNLMIEVIYVDNEIAEAIVNEYNEVEDELNFIANLIMNYKGCKKCKDYKDLLADHQEISKRFGVLLQLAGLDGIPF